MIQSGYSSAFSALSRIGFVIGPPFACEAPDITAALAESQHRMNYRFLFFAKMMFQFSL